MQDHARVAPTERKIPPGLKNLGSRLAEQAAGQLSALLLCRALAPMPSVCHWKALARLAVSAKNINTPRFLGLFLSIWHECASC